MARIIYNGYIKDGLFYDAHGTANITYTGGTAMQIKNTRIAGGEYVQTIIACDVESNEWLDIPIEKYKVISFDGDRGGF